MTRPAAAPDPSGPSGNAIEVGLNAAVVAVDRSPFIMVVEPRSGETLDGLPYGPFDPVGHRTMEMGLRAWVAAQTELRLGYVEQLYTFGDRGRHSETGGGRPRVMSVGYLALVRTSEQRTEALARAGARWQPWYAYFPWEDWRAGKPEMILDLLEPLLEAWCARPAEPDAPVRPIGKRERVRLAFGQEGVPWDEEGVLDRFELLYEAGLVEEARRDGRAAARHWEPFPSLGRPMQHDHRRILATAISRLRGKMKYRPVVFELMPETFTLTELQRTVEAIAGRPLHKGNFRRLVDREQLVEPSGGTSLDTGGRPAALYRFRRQVMHERSAAGFRMGVRL